MFICPNLQSTATTIAVQQTTKQECQCEQPATRP